MENEYEFKRVDDTSALLNFKCGIEPIDKFIEDKKNGLDKYGAQNEVYNDDWAENGLIVLCFS